MPAWYRLSFEPQSPNNKFQNSKEFDQWVHSHFSDFNTVNAGYMVQPAGYSVGNAGGPFWNIIIHKSERLGEPNIIDYLTQTCWMIGDHYAHLYLKNDGGSNEILYPIRGGINA